MMSRQDSSEVSNWFTLKLLEFSFFDCICQYAGMTQPFDQIQLILLPGLFQSLQGDHLHTLGTTLN